MSWELRVSPLCEHVGVISQQPLYTESSGNLRNVFYRKLAE